MIPAAAVLGDPGRQVRHDPKSRQYPAPQAPAPVTVEHDFYGQVLDQGRVRCCTGAALAHLLSTGLFRSRHGFSVADALTIHARGTALHGKGWPDADEGLSSLDAAKASESLGFITRYQWAFGINELLCAMAYKPFVIGLNWYQGMSMPDPDGWIRPVGKAKGGHALVAVRLDMEEEYLTLLNSWGPRWGVNGRARIGLDDLARLLDEEGDCMTVSVPVAKKVSGAQSDTPVGRGN